MNLTGGSQFTVQYYEKTVPLRGKASYMTVCIWPIRNCEFNPQQQDFQI